MAAPYTLVLPPDGQFSPIHWAFVKDAEGRDQLMVSLSKEGNIDEERWAAFMNGVATRPGVRVLGTAIGSININSVQRTQAAKIFNDLKISVVVDSSVARGVATALGWLGLKIKAYRWSQLAKAVENLELSGISQEDIERVLIDLLRVSDSPSFEEMRTR